MEQYEKGKTIGELSGKESWPCYGCDAELANKTMDEVFVDGFFLEVLGGLFCTEQCRDSYIDSK